MRARHPQIILRRKRRRFVSACAERERSRPIEGEFGAAPAGAFCRPDRVNARWEFLLRSRAGIVPDRRSWSIQPVRRRCGGWKRKELGAPQRQTQIQPVSSTPAEFVVPHVRTPAAHSFNKVQECRKGVARGQLHSIPDFLFSRLKAHIGSRFFRGNVFVAFGECSRQDCECPDGWIWSPRPRWRAFRVR